MARKKRGLEINIPKDTNIEKRDVTDLFKESFAEYSKHLILYRAIPDNKDGLKPVQRRILYAMYNSGNTSEKPHRKSAKAVGDIMGNYHPHGDCLYGDTLIQLTNGEVKRIEDLYKDEKDVEIYAVDKNNNIVKAIAHSFRIGQFTDKIYKISLSDGREVKATGNHPFLMASDFEKEGHVWKKAEELKEADILYSGSLKKENKSLQKSHVISIVNIEIENVNQVPMYDFTVDNHENMLLFNDLDNGYESFIVAHNSSIYEAMIRLGKSWVNNLELIDTQGNNGSIDGDSPSAMRYTESRVTKVVSEFILDGIKKKGIVPMIPTYDDKGKEPVIVPTRIPLHIVNGTSGISNGYATDILPHNLKEVMTALIEINSKGDITNEELFQIIPAPDFPTCGVLTGGKNYMEGLVNGELKNNKNSVYLRAKYRIDGNFIDITEIPYGVVKVKLVNKIRELCDVDKKDIKKFQGFKDVTDLSDRDGILIRIELTPETDHNKALAYLFSKTQLRNRITCNNVVIAKGKPQQLGLKEILKDFNEHRKETVIRELNYDLSKLQASLHLVDGFVKLSDILEDVLKVIKESNGKKDARDRLISEFDFSEIQAEAIVSIALHRISKSDKEQYIKEKAQLEKEISHLEALLNSRTKLKNYINKQYEEVITKYGKDRQTQIIEEEENWEITLDDTIVEEDVYIGVSQLGYIKRSNVRSYNTTEKADLMDGDKMLVEGQYTTKDVLMVFTNLGNYAYIPVFNLEESRWKPVGKHLGTIVNLQEGEEVISAFVVNLERDKHRLILTAKNDGRVKVTTVEEHAVSRRFSSTFPSIKITKDEKLLVATLLDEEYEANLGFILENGKSMYFKVSEIIPKGLRTEGMKGISLKDDGTELIKEVVFSYDDEDFKDMKLKKRGGRPSK